MWKQTDDDAGLLGRALAGDAEAFTTLYRRRQGAVYRFALHMSGSASVADDVTQETFLALLREGRAFDPSRGPLPAYLAGIARKQVLKVLSRDRVFEPGDVLEDRLSAWEDALGDLLRRESVEAVRRAVLALPAQYREVVVLCELEEMDYAGAALALGVPLGTVRSRLNRGRRLLMERLGVAGKEARSVSARCTT